MDQGSSINSARIIGFHEGGLYRPLGEPTQALVHDNIDVFELWHRIYDHIHYRAMPTLK